MKYRLCLCVLQGGLLLQLSVAVGACCPCWALLSVMEPGSASGELGRAHKANGGSTWYKSFLDIVNVTGVIHGECSTWMGAQLFIMIRLTLTTSIKIKWIVFCTVAAWREGNVTKYFQPVFWELCTALLSTSPFPKEPAKVGARGMWLIGESQCLYNSCHCGALGFLLHPMWHKWPLSKGTALYSHCHKCIQTLLGCSPALAACKRDSAVLPLVLCACPYLIAPLALNLWSWRMGQTNLLILWKSALLFTRAWAGWWLNFVRLPSCPNWPVTALLGKL